MVVRPKEIDLLTESEHKELEELEKFIDAQLREYFLRKKYGDCSIEIPSAADARICSALRELYQDAGWIIVVSTVIAGKKVNTFTFKKK